VAAHDELRWSRSPFLSSSLPGGGAELALVVGFGMTEDRDQEPRVCNPHGFNVAWLRAEPGEGMLRHRHHVPQVLMAKDGGWKVWLGDDLTQVEVELGPWDMLSIPPGSWRRFANTGSGSAEMVVVNGGDGRVGLEWDPDVVARARDQGRVHDAGGYAAPLSVVRFSTIDT
jgi:mannose-6-phosphate isomerase-like protein (cupin superfamily)